MATHHDRVTTDVGSNTVFGDDREHDASRQTVTGTATGTGALADDQGYGGSGRTTGMGGTSYGDDQGYVPSRTTGATGAGYRDEQDYGSSSTSGITGTGYADDQAYGPSRATGTGTSGLSYDDQGYNSTTKGRNAIGGDDDDVVRGSTTTTGRTGVGAGVTGTGLDDSSYGTGSSRTDPDRMGSDAPIGSYDNFRSDAATRDGHTLLSEHPAREEIPERKGSLASTPGPFQVPTTDDPKGTSPAVTSSVSSQNAPGTAGKVGEGVMGALGVGGTHVERPKEEQGLGEKIVNLLGG